MLVEFYESRARSMDCFRNMLDVSVLAAACLSTVQPVEAYEHPLTVSAIHEAYVLGVRNDQATLLCWTEPQRGLSTRRRM